MTDKGGTPPPPRGPPDRRPGVLDRPLMERNLFDPEKLRVIPPVSQIPRRIGSPPLSPTPITSRAIRTLSHELATTSHLAVKRAPQTESDELQDEKRPKPGSRTPSSDEESDSSTPPPTPEKELDAPITRHINPPKLPSPTKTLTDIPTETQEMDAEPVPGPSTAPDTYARIAAAPKATRPPSPRTTGPTPPIETPTAANKQINPENNTSEERQQSPHPPHKPHMYQPP
ncbi:unnamed protein product [Parnassius apollo]|uniref:(apollo) hypothetical protein n=1 Tax=Parnassius apollo TaxID=110799 RepID=A0A8S3WH68_PARAO|nr:unnamed protein product [Parnassius apollo]